LSWQCLELRTTAGDLNNLAQRLLFLGSSCIYPKCAEQTIREEALLTGALESINEFARSPMIPVSNGAKCGGASTALTRST
jgi:hypothetical protein